MKITVDEALRITHLFYAEQIAMRNREAYTLTLFSKYKIDPTKFELSLDTGEFKALATAPKG